MRPPPQRVAATLSPRRIRRMSTKLSRRVRRPVSPECSSMTSVTIGTPLIRRTASSVTSESGPHGNVTRKTMPSTCSRQCSTAPRSWRLLVQYRLGESCLARRAARAWSTPSESTTSQPCASSSVMIGMADAIRRTGCTRARQPARAADPTGRRRKRFLLAHSFGGRAPLRIERPARSRVRLAVARRPDDARGGRVRPTRVCACASLCSRRPSS